MIVSVALSLFLCAADPGVQAIANARALVDDFQFEKALWAIVETLEQPNLDTGSLSTLFELEAIARSTKGDTAGAKDASARLLVVDPAHVMPNEPPPRVRTLYFGAKTVAAREALGFATEAPVRVDGFIETVRVVVKRSALVAGIGIALAVQSADARKQITSAPLDTNGVVTGLTQAKAQQLDATARSSALAGNVLMIAGGVATVGGR